MAVDTYALTSLVNLKLTLGISASTDDTLLEDLIDRASDILEDWLGFKVMARDWTEWYDLRGGASFRLRSQPVNTVRTIAFGIADAITLTGTDSSMLAATVSANGTNVIVTTTNSSGVDTVTTKAIATYPSIALMAAQLTAITGVSATAHRVGRSAQLGILAGATFLNSSATLTMAYDNGGQYRVDEDTGTVWIAVENYEPLSNTRACGPQRVLAEYNAGESTVPDDIEAACIAIASELWYARARDPGLQSESLGQYSYVTKIVGENATLQARLHDLIGARRRIR